MNGFLTDFWRDTIQVVELLLALVPVVLAVVARLATAKTQTGYRQTARAKFSLFEYSPQRDAKKFTKEQILSVKILTGSAIVTFLSSYYLPTLDTSSPVGAILKFFLVILGFGGALLQVGLALALAFEALVQRYPKLELWFSDTAAGNGLASLLCLFVSVPSLRVLDSVAGRPMSWSSYLMLAYFFSVYFYAFARLLIGVGLAVEHAADIIKKPRR